MEAHRIFDYVVANKEWIFSGIGVPVILGALRWLFRSRTLPPAPADAGQAGDPTVGRGQRLEFADGTVASAKMRFAYRIKNALLYFQTFKHIGEVGKSFGPLVSARANYLLEAYSFEEAKRSRRAIELALVKDLQDEFAKVGLALERITIGSLIRASKDVSTPATQDGNDRKTDSAPLTPISYTITFDLGRPGGLLTLTDGTRVRLELRLVCRIVNPMKAMLGTSEKHFMDALTPFVYARVHQIVESQSLTEARASRKRTEALLRTELEAEFKKLGLTIDAVLISTLESIDSRTGSANEPTRDTGLASVSSPEDPKSPKPNVYVANAPLDPQVTSDEIEVLKRFCSFPSDVSTQGYRNDYLFDRLLPDLPATTLRLLLESLFIKGYIAIQTTVRHRYYRLSEAGVRFAVNSGLATLTEDSSVSQRSEQD